ncbi:tyrosine-type recombinase/integrase [Haloarcula litorea]|uniref:tyrosine-type recombinase/integrase n=1 Tax=Haloarcula litorea TaxID=3032579 RepID=UPI0023E80F0C|nr:site-specific integrase [Halomicroarcula sp. GDY20]
MEIHVDVNLERFLSHSEEENTPNYHRQIKYTIEPFAEYCRENDRTLPIETEEDLYTSADHIEEFFQEYPDSPKLSSTRLSHIRTFLDFFKEDFSFRGRSQIDDLKDMMKIGNFQTEEDEEKENVEKRLSDDEIEQACQEGTEFQELVVRILFDTGCRKQEVAALKPKDIDFDHNEVPAAVKIERAYDGADGVKVTKTEAGERTVELSSRAAELMQKYIDENEIGQDEFIFELKDWKIYRAVKHAFTQAQVRVENGEKTNVTPHWMRHNRNTRIKEEHGPVVAQKYIGHGNVDMTDHYTQFDPDEVQGLIAGEGN